LFGFLAFGQVTRDLSKSDDVSRRIADRIDDDIGPKACSVFADAPAFGFEFPFTCGGLQRKGGLSGYLVFLAVKPRKVLTDDFIGCVPLETLSAGIPGRYDAGSSK
jgi:hypothetical protein